ncbi:putative DNA-binding protein [Enterococcus faecalis M7]|nr:putative DNA-binding protein [Enterococcus faecalis OG1X]ELA05937.1 putative DNA-binding protein [Enterococcus faecalis M7]
MYQVITMYGDNEPWWFFDDWQEDIVQEKTFDNLTDAETYYVEVWQKTFSELYIRQHKA